MPTRLTLTLPPTLGNQTIEVDTKRFTIGRTPENDLVIEDTSLSRRRAADVLKLQNDLWAAVADPVE